jgi:hypothetical protein
MSKIILFSIIVILVLTFAGVVLSAQPAVRAAQQTPVLTATGALPFATPTSTPSPIPTQIIVVVVTPVASPTPEPPFLEKYQTEIVTAVLSLISGVLLTLLFPAFLKYGKQGLTWLYQKLRIERQLHGHYRRNVADGLRKLKIRHRHELCAYQ